MESERTFTALMLNPQLEEAADVNVTAKKCGWREGFIFFARGSEGLILHVFLNK